MVLRKYVSNFVKKVLVKFTLLSKGQNVLSPTNVRNGYLSDLNALNRVYMHMHSIVIISGNCFGGSGVLIFTKDIVYKKKLKTIVETFSR